VKTHLSSTLRFTLCAALGAIGACGSEALEESTAAHGDALSSSLDFAVRRDPQGGYLVKEAGAALETHVSALHDASASTAVARAIAGGAPDGLLLSGFLDTGKPSGESMLVVIGLAGRNNSPRPGSSVPRVNPGEVNISIPAPWRPGPPPEGPDQP
jgi:hypothetical protein